MRVDIIKKANRPWEVGDWLMYQDRIVCNIIAVEGVVRLVSFSDGALPIVSLDSWKDVAALQKDLEHSYTRIEKVRLVVE